MISSRDRQFRSTIVWTRDELEADRLLSQDEFRRERLKEPLEAYVALFDQIERAMARLLDETLDLSALDDQALTVLSSPALQEALRYLVGPPISLDDLKVLADAPTVSPPALRNDTELVRRIIATIRAGLDRRRFPWVLDGRQPTEAERRAAIVASTALLATQRTATGRRSAGKSRQEERVRLALLATGFLEVDSAGRDMRMLSGAPRPGEFCRESLFGERKADLIVGLWDGRVMPVECKVSNSSTNSVKRLNNDAAIKAETWRLDFGQHQVVPIAVLSGVYKLHNLENAQRRGLTLYWAHRLADLVAWIESTRSPQMPSHRPR